MPQTPCSMLTWFREQTQQVAPAQVESAQVQQPIQVVMPKQPFWNGQAVATLVAATAALVVLVVTIKHNRAKLRTEQLEKRAKDREQRLLDLYGAFCSAGFQVITALVEVQRKEEESEELANVHGNSLVREEDDISGQLEDEQALLEREGNATRETRTKLRQAYSNLMMSDDSLDRLNALYKLFSKLITVRAQEAKAKENRLSIDLQFFAAGVGHKLHTQYLAERKLAEDGVPPQRPLTKYDPTHDAWVEVIIDDDGKAYTVPPS